MKESTLFCEKPFFSLPVATSGESRKCFENMNWLLTQGPFHNSWFPNKRHLPQQLVSVPAHSTEVFGSLDSSLALERVQVDL